MTQLAPNGLKPSESIRNQWHAEPEHGTPPEALLDPAYWAHVSVKMRRKDIVCALAVDNSYFSELLVIDVGKNYAKVVQLRCVQITQAQIVRNPIPDGFEIKFRGKETKWSVLRGKDVLKDKLETPDAAEQWLADHVKTLKAA
jgi:hypothetical protein